MFDPKVLFPIVRKSVTKGTDKEVMDSLAKLAQAHPELSPQQALAALSSYAQQKSGGAPVGKPAKPKLSQYLAGRG